MLAGKYIPIALQNANLNGPVAEGRAIGYKPDLRSPALACMKLVPRFEVL